jgi:hypothetical protein
METFHVLIPLIPPFDRTLYGGVILIEAEFFLLKLRLWSSGI